MTEENKKGEVALKEEKILEFWNEKEIFKKSEMKDAPNGTFVFYDGPPFATGLPHYGHILPGTIKDVIPRYQTMNGKRVLRRWGWDCHGLPIENLIERELDLKSKKDIENYGVEKFNSAARGVVLRYADEWRKIIPRSGRWIDMDSDYRTMDTSYTESVWWSFKTLNDKGLVYQAFKSMLFCPHCETTLSNFEVNQGYKDTTDISVFVKFELVDEPGTFVIAWTTTPWTLPGNVALAINKDSDYLEVLECANPAMDGKYEISKEKYIIAKDILQKNEQQLVPNSESKRYVYKDKIFEVKKEIKGLDLIGKSYKPVFDYYQNKEIPNIENGWKIYHGDFVTMDSGTGVVHIAPAFGEDDYELSKKESLPFIQHVAKDGTFKSEVSDFVGMKVKPKSDDEKERFSADIAVIKYLQDHGTFFAKEKLVHPYPHCWRCDTPLLNYATTSWFVNVTKMKDRLVEINKGVSWTPAEIGEGRFGKWLEGARDWAVSRSRYWGAPLPVWENEKGERTFIGSIDELKSHTKKSGNKFFVMRHGQTENNIKNLWSIDPKKSDPITKEGESQVITSAQILVGRDIDTIITSPFERTQETAKIVAKNLGISDSNIVVDERLGEWNVGKEFDGKDIEEFFAIRNKTTNDRYNFKTEDGESYADVLRRVGELLYEVDEKYKDKNILFISHGAPMRALSQVATGYTIKNLLEHNASFHNFENGEVREIDFSRLPHNDNYELDLHRPYIDNVEIIGENGERLTRVLEVFDTWYDSGSMPFASQHYPFENKEEFEKSGSLIFPADFIAEGLDQTRGWFYTLLVMSAGLFDRSPYKHVLVNGLVLAEDGKKMSKKLKNYPDLMDIVNKYGADSMRYYLLSSPLVKAEDFNFSEKGVDDISKKLVQKLYNVVSFYEMYPTTGSGIPEPTVLDKWVLSRLNELNYMISTSLDKYELDRASRPILDFVDDLSTWYLRRSRDRFKSEDITIKHTASYYMTHVLRELSKIIAPFVPFTAEEVYSRVGGEKESVHLENWPKAEQVDSEIIESMKKVREVVTSALEIRQKSGHKVRQPLAKLSIPEKLSQDLLDIIADEVNVKEVVVEGTGVKLDTELTEDLKKEGIARDIIRSIQDARKKENLNPNDAIKIVMCTDKKEIVDEYMEMIKSPTGVTEISYTGDKQVYPVEVEGETTFSVIK